MEGFFFSRSVVFADSRVPKTVVFEIELTALPRASSKNSKLRFSEIILIITHAHRLCSCLDYTNSVNSTLAIFSVAYKANLLKLLC